MLKECWISITAESCHYSITSNQNVRERKRRSELGICRSASRPVSYKTHKPHLRAFALVFPCSSCYPPLHSLKSSAVLLVDVPVALLLHPVLENHGDAEDENEVDTNNAKCCSEDLVEILVGE